MEFSYLIKCDTKEEMELITRGLELEHESLFKLIDSGEMSENLKSQYWFKLQTVKDMLEKFRKEF